MLPDGVLLCIDNSSPDAVAREQLAAAGFDLAVAEDELRRPTLDAPPRELPEGLAFAPWSEAAAPLFFRAYSEAFRERPGFPNWDEARWRASFTDDGDFRPDLSAVVLDGGDPAAFAVLWVEDRTGWVTQMGVRPGWRGKGVGEALLSDALRAFEREGIETAALEVATNNPSARALYERMGFELAASHESWRNRGLKTSSARRRCDVGRVKGRVRSRPAALSERGFGRVPPEGPSRNVPWWE